MRIDPMNSSLFVAAARWICSLAFWISPPIWVRGAQGARGAVPPAGGGAGGGRQLLHRPADLAREERAEDHGERGDDGHQVERPPPEVDRGEEGLLDVDLDDDAPARAGGNASVGSEHPARGPVRARDHE